MGHLVFAAPSIARFHLHERLQRELRFREHRVTWLCTDPVAATFCEAQAMPVARLRRARAGASHAPLARLEQGAREFFDGWRPDLVLLHGARSAIRGLLQFLAQEHGSRVLWTGDGLLPHTMQIDVQGIDGDSSVRRRPASDYASVSADAALLDAALSAFLARSSPLPLSRRPVRPPPPCRRLRDALAAVASGRSPRGAWSAWRTALELERDSRPPPRPGPPSVPFLCVLLQRDDDPRLRLDAASAPGAVEIAAAALAASEHLGMGRRLVAVMPEGGLRRRDLDRLRTMEGVLLEPSTSTPEIVAAASAMITVNHPLGAAALLAGTPLVHLGKALYELVGVTVRGRHDSLAEDLDRALCLEGTDLRRRFLTWLFARGHVWCSADAPDHNGMAGLVQAIEQRLEAPASEGMEVRYRAGPSWPLTAESPGG